jgi:NAD(P)-dependent dehydrogenase (short-subunit alcohol dehydrogenase family)
MAVEGCNLIVSARDVKALNNLSRELARKKIRVLAHPCDVRDPNSVDDLFRAARREFRSLDILVNNAGIAHPNLPVDQLPYPVWKNVFATNVDGTFLVTQAALVLMKRGGTIINNLSIAATRVFSGTAAYTASKHAALGLTNTLREELRPRGIRVIGLFPGATDTDIWKTLWPQAPRKKMMSAETVAKAVLEAVLLPPDATVETLEVLPTVGTL